MAFHTETNVSVTWVYDMLGDIRLIWLEQV